MTVFLNFRSAPRGGGVLREPQLLEGDGLMDPVKFRALTALPADRIAGRELVFTTHGFNVDFRRGVHALARMEQALALPSSFLFIGVLWPGDFWIPVINYPTEAGDAVLCGRGLARYTNARLSLAANLSFVSHSLGGRLVLEAVKNLTRRAREVCLLAAAVDDNCLSTRQYMLAHKNASRVRVLASKGDWVLRIAYPFGDFFSDLFGDDDSLTRAALGFHGPRPRLGRDSVHAQIPGTKYGHGDYLPPGELSEQITLQSHPIRWVSEALRGQPQSWP